MQRVVLGVPGFSTLAYSFNAACPDNVKIFNRSAWARGIQKASSEPEQTLDFLGKCDTFLLSNVVDVSDDCRRLIHDEETQAMLIALRTPSNMEDFDFVRDALSGKEDSDSVFIIRRGHAVRMPNQKDAGSVFEEVYRLFCCDGQAHGEMVSVDLSKWESADRDNSTC